MNDQINEQMSISLYQSNKVAAINEKAINALRLALMNASSLDAVRKTSMQIEAARTYEIMVLAGNIAKQRAAFSAISLCDADCY